MSGLAAGRPPAPAKLSANCDFHQGYSTPCPAESRYRRQPGLCYPAKDQQELAAECRRSRSMLVPDKRPLLEISSCELADPEALTEPLTQGAAVWNLSRSSGLAGYA
jgi:hypothetical protein